MKALEIKLLVPRTPQALAENIAGEFLKDNTDYEFNGMRVSGNQYEISVRLQDEPLKTHYPAEYEKRMRKMELWPIK